MFLLTRLPTSLLPALARSSPPWHCSVFRSVKCLSNRFHLRLPFFSFFFLGLILEIVVHVNLRLSVEGFLGVGERLSGCGFTTGWRG